MHSAIEMIFYCGKQVLGLGVISLSLVFVDPILLKICVKSSSSSTDDYEYYSPPTASSDASQDSATNVGCPEGEMLMTSRKQGHDLIITISIPSHVLKII
jgi:hypothetical protein